MAALKIGIVVALTDELRPLNRLLSNSVSLCRTGMGPANARFRTGLFVRGYSPSIVLIAGFGGGLSDAIQPGDLVVADSVVFDPSRDPRDSERYAWPSPMPVEIQWHCPPFNPLPVPLTPTESALQLAHRIALPGVGVHFGPIVTTPAIIDTGKEKRELSEVCPSAIALDMESAGAAAACEQAGVPWLAVRAITDSIDDELPFQFEDYLDESIGEVSRKRIARAAMLHPTKIPALMRLGRRSAIAARNLALFVEAYIERLP